MRARQGHDPASDRSTPRSRFARARGWYLRFLYRHRGFVRILFFGGMLLGIVIGDSRGRTLVGLLLLFPSSTLLLAATDKDLTKKTRVVAAMAGIAVVAIPAVITLLDLGPPRAATSSVEAATMFANALDRDDRRAVGALLTHPQPIPDVDVTGRPHVDEECGLLPVTLAITGQPSDADLCYAVPIEPTSQGQVGEPADRLFVSTVQTDEGWRVLFAVVGRSS